MPWCSTHINQVQGLVNTGLHIEAELRIHLRRHLAWHNLQDLATEFDEQCVEGSFDLLIDAAALLLAVGDGIVDQAGVVGFLGGGEDQGRVGGCVLRLVLLDGGEVAGVGNDGLSYPLLLVRVDLSCVCFVLLH